MFLSGLASLLCPLASSYWTLVLYVAVLGILDGSFRGLMSIVTLDIVGVHKIAPAWGILFFCQSFTYLLGPPAAGTSEVATLETPRRKLGRISFRKDFWDSYCGRAGQLLANFFFLSSVTVPEVFAKINSTGFVF